MLNYTDCGHGKTIVFIHGFCENLKIWQAYEEEFSKFSRVICIDLPGFGASNYDEETITIEWFASKVHALLKELNVSTYHVVGHSLGGYIALALAERYPSSLTSMTLFHSTSYADTEEKKLNRDKVISFIERNGLSLFMDSFVTPLFADGNKEKCKESIDFLIKEGKKSNQDAVISTLLAMKNRIDRRHVLAQFNKPLLMIIGEDDLAVPVNTSLEQLEINPKIENIVLKTCGHMGMFEKPNTCLTKLKEFVFSV